MKRRKILAAASSLAVLAALLTGCGAQPQESSVTAGVLTLRVNPEIAIHYNQSGKVVALEGDNQDGREIVETYPDYIGKDCEVVVQELVEEIHAAGYFVEEVEGHPRRVVLELDDDSQEPREGFLEDMSRSAQDALEGLSLGSAVVVEDDGAAVSPSPKASEAPVGASDYNDTDYGPNNDGVTDYNDTDYGPNNDGVTDYNDTDYGPNNDGVTDSTRTTAPTTTALPTTTTRTTAPTTMASPITTTRTTALTTTASPTTTTRTTAPTTTASPTTTTRTTAPTTTALPTTRPPLPRPHPPRRPSSPHPRRWWTQTTATAATV